MNYFIYTLHCLLDSRVSHWGGFGGFTVAQETVHHAILELADNCDEFGWAAEFSRVHPD